MSETLDHAIFLPPAAPFFSVQIWLPWPPESFDYITLDDGSIVTTDGGEPINFT